MQVRILSGVRNTTGVSGFDIARQLDICSQTWVESINNSQTINADYDVVAEAEAILAEAALVSA